MYYRHLSNYYRRLVVIRGALFFGGPMAGSTIEKEFFCHGGLYAGNHRGVRGPSGGVTYVGITYNVAPWRACASIYLLRFVSRLKDLCSDLRCRLNHSSCSRSPPHKRSYRTRSLQNPLFPLPPQHPTSVKLLGRTRFECI